VAGIDACHHRAIVSLNALRPSTMDSGAVAAIQGCSSVLPLGSRWPVHLAQRAGPRLVCGFRSP